MRRKIFTVCRYLYRIFYMVFMGKKFRNLTAFFALTFAAIFFAACSESNWNDGVHYIWLTGSNSGYRISEYDNKPGEYFREGYIYNKGFFGIEITSKNDKGNAAAEFKIIGSSLRIEIYERQTLPSGNFIYVYSGTTGAGELIGDIYITKTDDKPEFTYKSYDDWW